MRVYVFYIYILIDNKSALEQGYCILFQLFNAHITKKMENMRF